MAKAEKSQEDVLAELALLRTRLAELERAKEQLRRSQDSLAYAQRLAHLGSWEWDLETSDVEWSLEVYRIFGLDPERFSPKIDTVMDHFHPDDRDRARMLRQSLLAVPEPGEFDTRIVRPDGTLRILHSSFEGKYDEEGNLIGIGGVVHDMTEQKLAEEKLRESEERFRGLASLSPVGFFVSDVEGHPEYWNESLSAITGLAAEEIRGKGWLSGIHPDDRETVVTGWYQAVRNRSHFHSEHRFIDRQGSVTWTIAQAVPRRGQDGEVVGYIGTITDVNELKQAEEERRKLEAQVQHTQKLESLGVLAGGIAHDFNNLLVGILGNAELAMMDLSSASPARESVEQIRLAAQRAAELSRQMLAYSGKGKFVVETTDLNALVTEMVHLLEASVSKKAVLQYHLSEETPAIEADATQLLQVVMNLITNASEALGGQAGVVSIATGAIDLDRASLRTMHSDEDLPEGRYFYLEVVDTGCGMDAETRSKVFDPFFTTKFSGRGLGMSAVLGIVRGHRGAIQVVSEPGKGTSFRLVFPASDRSVRSEAASGRELRGRPSRSGTVLVVDDHEQVLQFVTKALERAGYTVLQARDGREGIQVFRERAEEIAVVLLDLTMPELSGEEAFEEIRRIKTDARVILSSGFSEEEASSRFTGKGLLGFLQKPYETSALLAKLHEAMEG
jgi:PAS domain S-box-containing protein